MRTDDSHHWLSGMMLRASLCLVGLLFLCIYAWLYFSTPQKFTSPDETANYFFLDRIAHGQSIQSPIVASVDTDQLIQPRSVVHSGGFLLPGSFLGLIILYGIVARFFGIAVAFIMTPALTVLSAFCFAKIVEKFFHRSTARICALLFLLHPAVWIYSSRSLFHNALFLDLVIIGGYGLLRLLQTKKAAWGMIAGLLLGFAVMVRTSEAIWLVPSLGLLLVLNRRHYTKSAAALFIGSLGIMLIMLAIVNTRLYGNPIASSYTNAFFTEANASTIDTAKTAVRIALLPFGIHVLQAAGAVWDYLLIIFPLFALMAVFGLVQTIRMALQRQLSRPERLYLYFGVTIATFLILYYGSWTFQEFQDPTRIILGSSYIRYWLPIYVLALPYCVRGFSVIGTLFSLRASVILGWLSLSLVLTAVIPTMLDPLYGFRVTRENTNAYAQRAREVETRTETNAIIVSGTNDKVFFPQRRVIVSLPENGTIRDRALLRLIADVPVYLYLEEANPPLRRIYDQLVASGWHLTKVATFSGETTLLRIEP